MESNPSAILKNVFSELFNTISLFIPHIITFVVRYLITFIQRPMGLNGHLSIRDSTPS